MQSSVGRIAKTMKFLAGQLLLLVFVLVLFDIAAYFFVPNSIAWQYHYYRQADTYTGKPASYPQNYYEAQSDRGFDIAANRETIHHLPEISYPIHSNSMGCFDKQWTEIPENYIYFAGDSFTWGFTPFGERFSDKFEESSGVPSLKCGVSSTSTLHQFDKFVDLTEQIGRYPETVVLSFFENDVVGDYLYPDSTVLDGWLVHKRYFDSNGAPIEVDGEWLNDKLQAALASPPSSVSCGASLSIMVQCYSLSANILNRILDAITGSRNDAAENLASAIDYNGQKIYGEPPTNRPAPSTKVFPYRDQPISGPNQQAFRTWQMHAAEHGYRLVVVLIPPPRSLSFDGTYYQEVVEFLQTQDIETIDLLPMFHQRGLQRHQLYWRYDGHLSPQGHAVVGEILVERLPSIGN